VERSADVGDDAAVALLAEAAHATTTRAPATAAGWFSAALRLLPATPESDGQRLGLLVPLASALGAAGRLREARDTLEELRVLIPPELGVARAQVTILRAQVDNLLGDHGSGRALLEATLEEYADSDPAVASDVKLAISADAFLAGDWEGMYSWAVPAYQEIPESAEPVVRASAAAHLAGACYITSRFDECVELLDTATALVDAAPDDQLAARLTSLHWLGWCEEYLQRYDASIAHLERCLSIARATGQGQLIVGMMTALSSSLAWSGRLHEAEDVVDAAAEAALLAGNDQFMVWALQVQSRVRLLRGDVRSAVDLAAEAARLSLDDPLTGVANCLHGEALIEAGEFAPGRDAILAGGGRDLSVLEQGSHPRWAEPMVRAQIALGDLGEAEHWVGVAESAASACAILPGRRSESLRARAEFELARGDAQAAADAALGAVEAAAAVTMPIETARGRMIAGRALAGAGDTARASAELEAARTAFADAGADRLRDAAAHELRRLGKRVARPRGRATTGGALSPREREIAELVTVGKTNRQIAADLFVSEKTVETHLSHVFAKLGVSSRAAVAGALSAGGTNGD
jgi:ATP/maltotriose-dependent transcriptional regulator MalT